MSRLLMIVALATTIIFVSGAANAQFTSTDSGEPRDKKTGRTAEGLKIDAEVDRLYRAKAGQRTPEVRADPWADVRTPSTPAAQPSAKAKQKQP